MRYMLAGLKVEYDYGTGMGIGVTGWCFSNIIVRE